MVCSFLCNGIIFGLINSYGAIYVALRHQYDLEKSENSETKASFIGSLLVGSTFVLSPVSGVLVDRFGIRKTAFIGGLIATAGVFISSFCVHNVSCTNFYNNYKDPEIKIICFKSCRNRIIFLLFSVCRAVFYIQYYARGRILVSVYPIGSHSWSLF